VCMGIPYGKRRLCEGQGGNYASSETADVLGGSEGYTAPLNRTGRWIHRERIRRIYVAAGGGGRERRPGARGVPGPCQYLRRKGDPLLWGEDASYLVGCF